MLYWNKGFIKLNQTKTISQVNVKSDFDKIEEIKKRLHPNNMSFKVNNNVNHMERINNLKKLK